MTKIGNKIALNLLNYKEFYYGNTEVINMNKTETYLKLFNHKLAHFKDGVLSISTSGVPTRTVINRLNSLPNVNVSYKKKKLTLNGKEWDGNWTKINI